MTQRIRGAAKRPFTAATLAQSAIQSLCWIGTLILAAQLTGNLGLFKQFLEEHSAAIVHTLCVAIPVALMVQLVAGNVQAAFEEWFRSEPVKRDLSAE